MTKIKTKDMNVKIVTGKDPEKVEMKVHELMDKGFEIRSMSTCIGSSAFSEVRITVILENRNDTLRKK